MTAEKIQPDPALQVKGRKGFAYLAERWHELGTQSRAIVSILGSRHRDGQVGMLADMINSSPVSQVQDEGSRRYWTKSDT